METIEFANNIRIATCEMLLKRGFGHLGAALSMVEALAVLYNEVMNIDPSNPQKEDRDWFILSKGHGGPSYYATLALKGYFNKDLLMTLNDNNTCLPSHPDRNKTKGVDATTGSLGQGISQAVGIAKALKIKGSKSKVYCIVGDGEMNEGQVYEALVFAVAHNLDNLTILLDNNKKQLDGLTKTISIQYNFKNFFDVIGFKSMEVDGASTEEIFGALKVQTTKPKAIVLDTIKCQGLPYFENLADNHHIRFTDEQKEILKLEITRLKELSYE